MGPAFERWIEKLTAFQTRRAAGATPEPWQELRGLEAQVDPLALEGLDSRAAAAALIAIERAGLLVEQREFEEACRIAGTYKPSLPLTGEVEELFESNRQLTLGYVYLTRDSNYALAADHFQMAIASSGPATTFIRGNAAINLGLCQSLLQRPRDAIDSYKVAAESYALAGRSDKRALVLHCIGNAYRALDETLNGIKFLQESVELNIEAGDSSGIWSTADDLARAYLTLSVEQPDKREEFIDDAARMADIAAVAGTEVWNTARSEAGRLADLSDQMINHTITRCDIAGQRGDPVDFLGTLALMKGRIRLSGFEIPEQLLSEWDADDKEALRVGVPTAYFKLVDQVMQSLADGRKFVLMDQLAVVGNQLLMVYMIVSGEDRILDGANGTFQTQASYDPSVDLRGRGRGAVLTSEVEKALSAIQQHAQRCQWVLPSNPLTTDDAARRQLESWAGELLPELKVLGDIFFPKTVLEAFRSNAVEHVVLAIDPLFARIPYQALVGAFGPILDEPWTLSLVTTSSELVRLVDRRTQRLSQTMPLAWFGPDKSVNDDLGGNAEVANLSAISAIAEYREDAATRTNLVDCLRSGCWCHFRGHGKWTGNILDSGPVLAGDEVLSASSFDEASGAPGFLFTAACSTVFGEAVGTEMFGSLVDYDRANLSGAILTSWPIHGAAATIFTKFFYEELRSSKNAAASLKSAQQRCRDILPHPYLWAPFSLVGDWSVGDILAWKGTEEGDM